MCHLEQRSVNFFCRGSHSKRFGLRSLWQALSSALCSAEAVTDIFKQTGVAVFQQNSRFAKAGVGLQAILYPP